MILTVGACPEVGMRALIRGEKDSKPESHDGKKKCAYQAMKLTLCARASYNNYRITGERNAIP
jgi:hypothetical protein